MGKKTLVKVVNQILAFIERSGGTVKSAYFMPCAIWNH
jgi:hypothetical protein